MEQEQIVYLSPDVVLADDNSRFSILPSQVDNLAASIIESGGVLSPVEVEVLDKKTNGKTHRLTAGFIRHAAVTKLNAEQAAGLELPCIVRQLDDPKIRLDHQLTENIKRANQSPMDQAVSIKKLVDAGVSKTDIRKLFSRPGGRKGAAVQMASNAWVNITLSLLDLPKSVQEKIHDGRVGFAAAYELGKVAPDKRAAVLERAEAERLAQLDKEDADERKYLAAEEKVAEVKNKAAAVEQEIAETKAAVADTGELIKAKMLIAAEVRKEPFLELDDAGKKALTDKLKVADADVKAAQKILKDSQNKLASLLGQSKKVNETVKDANERLTAARKAHKGGKKAKAVGPTDIKKGAAAEGAPIGLVKLKMGDIQQVIKDLQKEALAGPKVIAIGAALQRCFDSEITTKELTNELGILVGEVKAAAVGKAKK